VTPETIAISREYLSHNMPCYKPQDCNSLLLPVVLSEQIIAGSFAFALNYLGDSELDLSALDAKFKNDDTAASAYTQTIPSSVQLARNKSLTFTPTCLRSLKHLPSSQKQRRSGARKRGWSSSRELQVNCACSSCILSRLRTTSQATY
jgi:hypothetical protein